MMPSNISAHPKSKKEPLTKLLLCLLLGWTGAHRFYSHKIGTAILMFFTFGGLGIWWFFDIINILLDLLVKESENVVEEWKDEPYENSESKTISGIKASSQEIRNKGINRNILYNVIKKLGISYDNVNRTIGTLEITLARKVAKSEKGYIFLDKTTIPGIEDSLQIGANISLSNAKEIIYELQELVKQQEEAEVSFLDKGTFEFKEGKISYKYK